LCELLEKRDFLMPLGVAHRCRKIEFDLGSRQKRQAPPRTRALRIEKSQLTQDANSDGDTLLIEARFRTELLEPLGEFTVGDFDRATRLRSALLQGKVDRCYVVTLRGERLQDGPVDACVGLAVKEVHLREAPSRPAVPTSD